MPEIKKLSPGIAVIGTGYWGKNLVRNYAEMGLLKLICDRDEKLLAQFHAEYPALERCMALPDVLNRDDVQAVAIATPAETHFTIAREALLAGLHVYVEKPLVLNESEAEELINIAREKALILMVGHLMQYHPAFARLKEMVRSGELGRINYIYSHRLNLGKIRREENILWSFAPHDISMILSLAGEEPEAVLATGGNYLHKKIADVTTTHLEFPSGLKAHIFVSWLHPFKDQKMVVVGDRKMAVFDDTQPWSHKLLVYPHEIKWHNGMPIPAKAKPEVIEDIREAEPLRLECEQFVHCITTGQPPITDGNEGLLVLRILHASQESLNHEGRKLHVLPRTKLEAGPPQSHKRQAFIHQTAIVDENVSIGAGAKVWHFSHILSGSKIGENCNIGQNVVIGPDVTIGKGCKIQNNVSVYKGVTLEDDVFCGPSMVFTNVHNPRAALRKMDELRPTLLRKGSTIGANATIICGVTIGRYSFVGAGATVTKDVGDHEMVAGNPARPIGYACTCGEKLGPDLKCTICKEQYEEKQGEFTQKGAAS